MQAKLLAAVLAVAALPAHAQSPEPVRYQLISVSGGFVRLDAVSGAMTFCRDEADSVRCVPVPADAASAGIQPDAGATPNQMNRSDSGKRDGSSVEDFDRALSLMEKAMKSFMAMSRENPRDCSL